MMIGKFVHSILYKYVDWERMWYKTKCKLKKGDKVKLNWKAKVYFKDTTVKLPTQTMVVDEITKSGRCIILDIGDSWNEYWLTKIKKSLSQ